MSDAYSNVADTVAHEMGHTTCARHHHANYLDYNHPDDEDGDDDHCIMLYGTEKPYHFCTEESTFNNGSDDKYDGKCLYDIQINDEKH